VGCRKEMSVGRKAIRETIRNLKATVILVVDSHKKSWVLDTKLMSRLFDLKNQDINVINGLVQIITNRSGRDILLLSNIVNYVQALELYLSELDETFDKLLQEAKKEAEEEAKKTPQIPEDLYR